MASPTPRRDSRRYEYEPLPKGSYRILKLRAGSGEEPLCGTLIQIEPSASDSEQPTSRAPSYEAISYAWHRPEGRVRRPKLHMKDGRYLRLFPGLGEMLVQLRRPDRARKLWIDQISINQESAQEKSAQVAMMRLIYSKASRTVVWLGSQLENNQEAMETFKSFKSVWSEVVRRTELAIKNGSPKPREEIFATFTTGLQDLGDAATPALNMLRSPIPALLRAPAFYTHRWFGRLWPLQEVIVSSDVVVQCGNSIVAWELVGFFASLFLIHCRDVALDPPARRGIEAANLVYWHQLTHRHHFPLFSLLRTARGFETTDTVDKVFAVMGLSQEYHENEASATPSKNALLVDYSTSYRHLFTQVARYVIGHDSSLEMLASVEHHCCFNDHLPSWVPDWTDSGHAGASFWIHDAPEHLAFYAGPPRLSCSPSASSTAWDELPVRGAVVDTVVDVLTHIYTDSFVPYPSLSRIEWPKFIAWVDAATPSELASTTDAHAAILQQSITFTAGRIYPGNTISAVAIPGSAAPRRTDAAAHKANYCALLKRVFAEAAARRQSTRWRLFDIAISETLKAAAGAGNADAYAEDLAFYSWKRLLLRTACGRLALGPFMAQPGDLVSVMSGGRVPFLLRPRPAGERRYRLVGACYVNGIMYGECKEHAERANEEFVLS